MTIEDGTTAWLGKVTVPVSASHLTAWGAANTARTKGPLIAPWASVSRTFVQCAGACAQRGAAKMSAAKASGAFTRPD